MPNWIANIIKNWITMRSLLLHTNRGHVFWKLYTDQNSLYAIVNYCTAFTHQLPPIFFSSSTVGRQCPLFAQNISWKADLLRSNHNDPQIYILGVHRGFFFCRPWLSLEKSNTPMTFHYCPWTMDILFITVQNLVWFFCFLKQVFNKWTWKLTKLEFSHQHSLVLLD